MTKASIKGVAELSTLEQCLNVSQLSPVTAQYGLPAQGGRTLALDTSPLKELGYDLEIIVAGCATEASVDPDFCGHLRAFCAHLTCPRCLNETEVAILEHLVLSAPKTPEAARPAASSSALRRSGKITLH